MYNMHKDLVRFYNDHVRLHSEERKKLACHRNTNLDRLKTGLKLLSEDDETAYASYIDHCDQGSYAMHTLNQHDAKDYDLDHALIFRKIDLDENPQQARKHIERAFKRTNASFRTPPKARTNAVTVSYSEGYHIDFAIYRQYNDDFGATITEHAGGNTWNVANPNRMGSWFTDVVHEQSPSQSAGATVEDGQVRRVVRWLKAFGRSRSSWKMPGGIIISALVEELFQPDNERDDRSLYNTMNAIHSRLEVNLRVMNPIYPDQELTSKEKYLDQVEEFRDNLDDALQQLQILFTATCSRKEARSAWNWVFKHDFWQPDEDNTASKAGTRLTTGNITDAPTIIRTTETYG